jgi:hypothetical protein
MDALVRGNYKCGICGMPKKGHVCLLKKQGEEDGEMTGHRGGSVIATKLMCESFLFWSRQRPRHPKSAARPSWMRR